MASEAEKLIAALNEVARDADALARESSALKAEIDGLAHSPVGAKSSGALHAGGSATAAAYQQLAAVARAARSYSGRI